jgi:hypothetical protein
LSATSTPLTQTSAVYLAMNKWGTFVTNAESDAITVIMNARVVVLIFQFQFI